MFIPKAIACFPIRTEITLKSVRKFIGGINGYIGKINTKRQYCIFKNFVPEINTNNI